MVKSLPDYEAHQEQLRKLLAGCDTIYFILRGFKRGNRYYDIYRINANGAQWLTRHVAELFDCRMVPWNTWNSDDCIITNEHYQDITRSISEKITGSRTAIRGEIL